jgi:hypothetical protein
LEREEAVLAARPWETPFSVNRRGFIAAKEARGGGEALMEQPAHPGFIAAFQRATDALRAVNAAELFVHLQVSIQLRLALALAGWCLAAIAHR